MEPGSYLALDRNGIDGRHPEKAEQWRQATMVVAEHFWAFSEYVGRLMPYWDRDEQYRYEGLVGPTIKDGFESVGGGAGGGYGRCTAGQFGPWPGGLFHEWGHGDVVGHRYRQPHGEVYCQFQQAMASPVHLTVYNNVRNPWANAMFGMYNSNLFFILLGDDPNWGYGWLTGLPKGVDEPTAWMTIARVGEHRGLFEPGQGIRGVGDMVGEYAARSAEFDGEDQGLEAFSDGKAAVDVWQMQSLPSRDAEGRSVRGRVETERSHFYSESARAARARRTSSDMGVNSVRRKR